MLRKAFVCCFIFLIVLAAGNWLARSVRSSHAEFRAHEAPNRPFRMQVEPVYPFFPREYIRISESERIQREILPFHFEK